MANTPFGMCVCDDLEPAICLEESCPTCFGLDGEMHCPMCPCQDCVDARADAAEDAERHGDA